MIFLSFTLFYSTIGKSLNTWDSVIFTDNLRTSLNDKSYPNSVYNGYTFMVKIFSRVISFFVKPTINILHYFSLIFACLLSIPFYFFLKTFKMDNFIILLSWILFISIPIIWFHSTNTEVYIPTLFFSLSSLTILLGKCPDNKNVRLLSSSILFAVSIWCYVLTILFFPLFLLVLYFQKKLNITSFGILIFGIFLAFFFKYGFDLLTLPLLNEAKADVLSLASLSFIFSGWEVLMVTSPFLLFFSLIGLISLKSRKDTLFFVVWILLFFIISGLYFVYDIGVIFTYICPAIVFLAISGIVSLSKWLSKTFKLKLFFIFSFLYIIVLLSVFVKFLSVELTLHLKEAPHEVYANWVTFRIEKDNTLVSGHEKPWISFENPEFKLIGDWDLEKNYNYSDNFSFFITSEALLNEHEQEYLNFKHLFGKDLFNSKFLENHSLIFAEKYVSLYDVYCEDVRSFSDPSWFFYAFTPSPVHRLFFAGNPPPQIPYSIFKLSSKPNNHLLNLVNDKCKIVSGKIKNKEKSPLSGIDVIILNSDNNVIFFTYSDRNGNFIFPIQDNINELKFLFLYKSNIFEEQVKTENKTNKFYFEFDNAWSH